MYSPILDNSETYLRLFTDNIEIDYTLPKYKVVLKKVEEGPEKPEVIRNYSSDELLDTPRPVRSDDYYNGSQKRQALLKSQSDKFLDKEFFDNLSPDDLTMIIDEERNQGIHRRFVDMWESDMGSHWFEYNYVTPQEGVTELITSQGKLIENIVREKEKSSFWKRLFSKKEVSEEPKKEEIEKPKPTFEIDVIKFFDAVKLVTEQETIDYYNRVGAYLAALKKAKQIGQQALVDGWMSRIFVAKYESFLRAKGYHHKITENQMVSFIKKTEKGVALNYIKNFAHPIPDDVVKKKLEADSLHVFDNYVILHYDPKGKVYAKTEKEREVERAKKADPILFGIIAESRDLYYIADWIDQYCDLTLDKFLEVSGLDKESLEIGEKIQL